MKNAASTRGMTVEQKRKRRLARKAEFARESRKKKKMYVSTLESQITELKAQVETLRKVQKQQAKNNSRPPATILYTERRAVIQAE